VKKAWESGGESHVGETSLDEARAVTEAWREDYNRVRPHGALGNRTPSEFARPVDGHAQLPALHG
jgi:transposase InsO family protein